MQTSFKFYFISILFLVAGIFSWSLYFGTYLQTDRVNIHQLPTRIGEWEAEEMTITEEEYAILETRNVFSRRYKSQSGEEIYLFIVYSENNRKVSHPPEICYTGGGATVVESQHAVLTSQTPRLSIETNKLLLDFKNYQQIVHYWFKVGDSFTPNYWKQQLLIAIKTFLGKPSSSALIRISATVPDSDLENADKRIVKFADKLLPQILSYLP